MFVLYHFSISLHPSPRWRVLQVSFRRQATVGVCKHLYHRLSQLVEARDHFFQWIGDGSRLFMTNDIQCAVQCRQASVLCDSGTQNVPIVSVGASDPLLILRSSEHRPGPHHLTINSPPTHPRPPHVCACSPHDARVSKAKIIPLSEGVKCHIVRFLVYPSNTLAFVKTIEIIDTIGLYNTES